MATPNQLVLRSDVEFDAGRREAILDIWDEQTAGNKVNVRLSAESKAIAGSKGNFTLELTSGNIIRAETIVLAIGTQGQSQPDALPRRRSAARPVSARRSRRVYR
jgi:cGMP-dependent protein kinase 2